MKRLLFAILFATACLADGTVRVDLRKETASSIDIDMLGKERVEILIDADHEPDVLIQQGPLAHCAIDRIESVDKKTFMVEVEFEPLLDEGSNGCAVFLGGLVSSHRVNLNVYVVD